MEKRKLVFLLSISIITVFATIVGVTLVYLSSKINTESSIRQTIIQTESYPIAISYNKNGELKIENAIPGSSDSIDVTINNLNPKDSISYYLYWANTSNGFDISLQDLTYSVTCKANDSIVNQIPEKPMSLIEDNKPITTNIELFANTINICTIELKFLNNVQSPSANIGQSFNGTIKVGIR